MKHWRIVSLSMFGMAMCASSQAITFSNITVTDNVGNVLVAGNSVNPGITDIDFLFPAAFVGDPSVLRSGTITITFDADAGPNLAMNAVNLSVLGAVSGSGVVGVSEQVVDLITPGTIGSYSTTTTSTPFPITQFITFSRATTKVRVTKTLRLDAPFSDAVDVAQVSLVEQNFSTQPVPEPATLAILGVGAAAIAARRRRRS